MWWKFWRDTEDKVVVFQWPNAWLIIWVVCEFIAIISPSRSIYGVAWWIGTASLVIWAVLEILKGVNYFRRSLGFMVGVLVLISVLKIGL